MLKKKSHKGITIALLAATILTGCASEIMTVALLGGISGGAMALADIYKEQRENAPNTDGSAR